MDATTAVLVVRVGTCCDSSGHPLNMYSACTCAAGCCALPLLNSACSRQVNCTSAQCLPRSCAWPVPFLQHPELQQQQYQDPRQEQHWRQQQRNVPEQHKVLQRLLELSLQFCIYTEAANLRHTPHLLFLIYYIMRGSSKFKEVCEQEAGPAALLSLCCSL